MNAATGSQRLRCQSCRRYFTPSHERKARGHDPQLRERALKLALEGTSYRAVGRLLNVHHQSVANWVTAHAQTLPQKVEDTSPTDVVEIDELYTFVGKKSAERT
jgi:transposase-like protein